MEEKQLVEKILRKLDDMAEPVVISAEAKINLVLKLLEIHTSLMVKVEALEWKGRRSVAGLEVGDSWSAAWEIIELTLESDQMWELFDKVQNVPSWARS